MRRTVLAAVLLVLGAGAGRADDAGEIAAAIGDQMAAFAERDLPRAFDHASPAIRGVFGDPANFGRMVERGYPMVWDNAETRFLGLREVDGRLWQRVTVTDAAGRVHVLDYQMIETADGWLVNAVELVPAPGAGV